MGKRMNWDRAKPPRPSEMKFDEGHKFENGVVVSKSLDSLAKRARIAEKSWLKQNKMQTLADNPPKKEDRKRRGAARKEGK